MSRRLLFWLQISRLYLMNKFSLVLAGVVLLGTSLSSSAQSGWTSACSAGATIDETSQSLYQTNGSSLLFRAGQIGTVTARYNVTNAAVPNSLAPPWTTFELGYLDRMGGQVSATLFQVEPCSGRTTSICTMTTPPTPGPSCIKCTFPAGSIDFLNFVYFVQVDLTRSLGATSSPQATTLRLY